VTRYAIGLGSNLGERVEHLRFAVRELERVGEVIAVSSLYETAPVGGPDQGPYLNAVAVVLVEMDADSILAVCHSIEAGAGRVREERWGARTLDLDLLTSDEASGGGAALVPHPRLTEREFALRPLAEVWPEAPIGAGVTAIDGLAMIGGQGVDRLAKEWTSPVRPPLGGWLVAAQLCLLALIALAIFYDGELSGFGPLQFIGVLTAVLGAVMAVVAARQLGPALTPNPDPRPEADLVEKGLYRWVRHPVYGGVILFVLGAALAVGSWAGVAGSVVLTVFFLMKSTYEERRLRMRFGGYAGYMTRVRRRLIPYVI
jgi:2-amino-4-hydroxy-6-hydroxymethyldihydropteridine diphosphokinase